MPFILKRKLKFSLQRGHQVARKVSFPLTHHPTTPDDTTGGGRAMLPLLGGRGGGPLVPGPYVYVGSSQLAQGPQEASLSRPSQDAARRAPAAQ